MKWAESGGELRGREQCTAAAPATTDICPNVLCLSTSDELERELTDNFLNIKARQRLSALNNLSR